MAAIRADHWSIVQLEADEYVQPEYSEDHVNVNCVLSWRRAETADGDSVFVDFQNGWVFSSDAWREAGDVRTRVLSALKRNEAGKLLRSDRPTLTSP